MSIQTISVLFVSIIILLMVGQPSTKVEGGKIGGGEWAVKHFGGGGQRYFYDEATKRCALARNLEEAKKQQHKKLKEINTLSGLDKKCMSSFHQLSVKQACGSPSFDSFAYCAKANFYGQHGATLNNKGLQKGNEVKKPDDMREHYMQDMVLVLVDACIKCTREKRDAIFTLVQHYEPGPILVDGCKEEQRSISSTKNGIYVRDWTNIRMAGIASARLCPSRTDVNADPEIAKLNTNYDITLRIAHNCTRKADGFPTVVVNFKLPPVNLEQDVKDRVVQYRGFDIFLEEYDQQDGKEHPIFTEPNKLDGFSGKYNKAFLKPKDQNSP